MHARIARSYLVESQGSGEGSSPQAPNGPGPSVPGPVWLSGPDPGRRDPPGRARFELGLALGAVLVALGPGIVLFVQGSAIIATVVLPLLAAVALLSIALLRSVGRAARREHADGAREEAERLQKLATMGTLVAAVAHELKQPLTVLLGHTALVEQRLERLAMDREQAAPLERSLEAMRRAGTHMKALIDRLRTHGSAGVAVPVALGDAVRSALLLAQDDLRARDLVLDVSLRDAPVVLGDPLEIKQVVLNLVANARDAVGERPGGRISIRAGSDGSMGILEVSDNGPGVPDAHRERIFEPFFTTKPCGRGTGIGLAVVRGIVRRHGGDVELVTGNDGATFRVRLPLAEPRTPS